MAFSPRLLAPAFPTAFAAVLLAASGSASAVPVPVEQTDPSSVDQPAAASQQVALPTAQPLIGNPSDTGVRASAAAPVVEPGTLALLGLGLVLVGLTTSARSRGRRGGSGRKR